MTGINDMRRLSPIDYVTDHITLLESGVVEISEEFQKAVSRGEFIEPDDEPL